MVAADFHAFVDTLHSNLPDNILRVTVLNSVKGLLKQQLTDQLLFETCWRLAGNMERLLDQEPVPTWSRQSKFEWIPAEICEVATVKRFNRLENQIVFRSLAGSIVPRKLVQWWSFRKTSYLTTYRDEKGNGFGFGRHRLNRRGEQLGRLLFYDIRQFYGLQCLLLLDPIRSNTDPVATEIGHTGSMYQHNRQLLELRDRTESPCLKGYSEQQECFNCPYGEDTCRLATHPITYQVGKCPRCGTPLTFFDPAEVDYPGICVRCVHEERRS
jgi:hypothetical protein